MACNGIPAQVLFSDVLKCSSDPLVVREAAISDPIFIADTAPKDGVGMESATSLRSYGVCDGRAEEPTPSWELSSSVI